MGTEDLNEYRPILKGDRLTRNLTLHEWQSCANGDATSTGTKPYRKTCPNLPYLDDYEARNTSPLSAVSHWLGNLASAASP